jgi:hypothetical protein
MDTVLEIFKYTLPALIVFLTVYYLMRSYINGQLNMQQLKNRTEQDKFSLPLRLQAYERLILLCERLYVDSLLLRLRKQNMSGPELKNLLMLAVKQEFDHNLAQQLYVSSKLWEIITTAKDQVLDQLYLAERNVSGQDADAYSAELLRLFEKSNPVKTAKLAVIKEGQLYF